MAQARQIAGQQVPVDLIIVHHQESAGFPAGNGSTFLSQFPEAGHNAVNQRRLIRGPRGGTLKTGIKVGKIDDVVEARQEEVPGGVDLFKVGDNFFLLLFRRVFQQDFAVTDNAVQWGAGLIVQVGDKGFQIEGDIIGGKFLGIQEVIDDGQELTAGGEDLFEVGGEIRQAGVVGVFQQHFAVADDGVQRGSQFMAQV